MGTFGIDTAEFPHQQAGDDSGNRLGISSVSINATISIRQKMA